MFGTIEEVRAAYDHNEVNLQAPITVRIRGDRVKTTVGRALLSEILPDEIPFEMINRALGKKEMAKLVNETFRRCGPKRTVLVADALRATGYRYSTKAGLSISIGDMVVPKIKAKLLDEAYEEVKKIKEQYSEGLLTEGERYNKVIDIWAKVTESIAGEMFKNISTMSRVDAKGVSHTVPSTNSIYMMADSGARGSAQQIRQLAGMRGLMAKPSGEIIETPITSNFREGLTVLEYFTSTHGARKGLADTALKTASSGYLTRRLVDVAQDSIISEYDCKTVEGLLLVPLREGPDVKESLGKRSLGRVVLEEVRNPETGDVLVPEGDLVTEYLAERIDRTGVESARVRSTLTCASRMGACAKCYGRDLATGHLVNVGEAVGVIAAQSIGEPGTQLTMRTFHFGGAVSHTVETSSLDSRFSGFVNFEDVRTVLNREGSLVVLSRTGEIKIVGDDGAVKEKYPIIYGSTLTVKEGEKVVAGDKLAEWDPFTVPIIAEVPGNIRYSDLRDGQTMEERVDEITFQTQRVVTEGRTAELKPRIDILDPNGVIMKVPGVKKDAVYSLPVGAIITQDDNSVVHPGDILAKIPRETTKTKDITGGLPRVAELFEARKPKDMAIMADRDGTVSFGADTKGKRKLVLADNNGEVKEYLIPKGKHVVVTDGDYVRKGELLVDGQVNPHEILEVLGRTELARFLVDNIQQVYRLQGVEINDKHIEVIVRQMVRRVKIADPGDTKFLPAEQVDRYELNEVNERMRAEGKAEATFESLLLGITKASLSTESFISAASFQETTKVLTEAAINSKVDYLRGLKENVIMGRLIPAGTGAKVYRDLKAEVTTSKRKVPLEPAAPVVEQQHAAQ